jgi:hypothetical protein
MNHPWYQFTTHRQSLRFNFVSVGKTSIQKAVIFESLEGDHIFNLAMGDVDDQGELDVFSKSDNGDMQMVFATVIQIVKVFFKEKPNALIFIEGSTPARMRLYQIVIERELRDLEAYFIIHGFRDSEFELFRRNANFSVLAISLKKS